MSESPLRAFWRRYKKEERYQPSAFPFPPRRMSLFDKLHSDFIGILMIIGIIWLGAKLLRYFLS
jgi:hypothetical protein